MKIKLEDADVDAIASAVAAKIGKVKPGKPAADDAETGDEFGEAEAESTGEAADEFAEESGEAAEELTADDVRNALRPVVKKFDNETAMDILKKVGGVASLSKLKPAKFKAVIDAAKKKAK